MPLTVGILGNFLAPWCTEMELDWTFNSLGYQVLRFQENESRTDEIMASMCKHDAKLLVYVHTHGWTTPGGYTVDQLIEALRTRGVKTCSFHLDRYWGLNQADGRESRVGTHPFWKTDFVFTADGGNDEKFKERGVNHFWLPPGVVQRDCYEGHYDPAFAADVAFVGQASYHPEYPFRGWLIGWLKGTYGPRFRRFPEGAAIRGARLNDLYASVKVVVGDSCFAGSDRYWSDRVPETVGRGGFLIHPETPGLDIPGLVTFKPGDLPDLKEKIEYYLAHPVEREEKRQLAQLFVKNHATYTQRVQEMLKIMEL